MNKRVYYIILLAHFNKKKEEEKPLKTVGECIVNAALTAEYEHTKY